MTQDPRDVLAALATVSRAARARDRLTQAAVVERGGLGKGYVSLVECQRALPNIEQLAKLAKGLGFSSLAALWAAVTAEIDVRETQRRRP